MNFEANDLTILHSSKITGMPETLLIIWNNLSLCIEPAKILTRLNAISSSNYELKTFYDFEDVRQKFEIMVSIKNLTKAVQNVMLGEMQYDTIIKVLRRFFYWYCKNYDINMANNVKRNMKNFRSIRILHTYQIINKSTRIKEMSFSVTNYSTKLQHFRRIVDLIPESGRFLHFLMKLLQNPHRRQLFHALNAVYTTRTGNDLLTHPVWKSFVKRYKTMKKMLIKKAKQEAKRRYEKYMAMIQLYLAELERQLENGCAVGG